MQYIETLPPGTDVVEVCGGEGRVSILAIRRQCNVGINIDLVTHWDLNVPSEQEEVVKYFRKHEPLVCVMGPMCKPFGKLANYNYWHHYEAWLRSYQEAKPHGVSCARLALIQIREGRYFIVEQPSGSWLYNESPWPTVLEHKSIVRVEIHQCMLGQKTKEGLPAKKPYSWFTCWRSCGCCTSMAMENGSKDSGRYCQS